MLHRREFVLRTAALCAVVAAKSVGGAPANLSARLDREDLLTFRAADGSVQRVRSIDDWKKRRATILAGMQAIMGPLPVRAAGLSLDPQLTEEIDCGSYTRQLLSYQAERGGRVPAYLLVPKTALKEKGTVRAALCLHPTDMQNGHKTIVGVADKPSVYPKYAVELAERGWVALAPAYPLMAGYEPDLKALGYASGTMKAIWDNVRGIDFLESLPYVKREGVAAIGHSLGGHNSIYTAVFDERIKCVVSSCGFDSFLDYYDGNPAVWQREKGWVQTRYMLRLGEYAGRLHEIPFDFHELIGSLAPRACFINAPLGDSNFRWKSVEKIVKAARPVYELHKAGAKLEVESPDCAHEFPAPIRQKAYAVMEKAV
jgi:hypothetical protein